MIFSVFKTIRDVRKGVKDPTGFGQDALLEVLQVPLILFSVIGALGLGLFFILGYTDLIFSPLGFFRFLFWLGACMFFLFEIVAWSLYRKMKRVVGRVKRQIDEEVNTITVEPK